MSDWRDRLTMKGPAIGELSAEGMAAHRIMKSMGSSLKNIGSACRQLGIPYNEDETSFQRAVQIFRSVHPMSDILALIDAKSARRIDDILDDLLEDQRNAVIFFRTDRTKDREATMTAYVRGVGLSTSPLGQLVIRPGIRYVACRNQVQLWEQDPITLLNSFKKEA